MSACRPASLSRLRRRRTFRCTQLRNRIRALHRMRRQQRRSVHSLPARGHREGVWVTDFPGGVLGAAAVAPHGGSHSLLCSQQHRR